MTYQPKGGMCATCAKLHSDCSRLPFHTMPQLEKFGDVVIVRCVERVKA